MPFADIRLVAFAGYGTLFDLDGAVGFAADRLGAAAAPLAALWRAKGFEYATLSTLVGRAADAWSTTGEALDHALAALAIAEPLLRARLMQAALQAPLYPDAAPALAALEAARRKRALLTNASPTMATALAKAGGIYPAFDAILSTEAFAARKPQPAAYAPLAERFGIAPAQVLYVSAQAWDVAGAAQAGFASVWLNRAGAPAEYAWARPRASIASLGELATLLPAA